MTERHAAVLAFLSSGPKRMSELEAHFQLSGTTIWRALRELFVLRRVKQIRKDRTIVWARLEDQP